MAKKPIIVYEGGHLSMQAAGTIAENDQHKIFAAANASRNIKHHDQWVTGASIDYTYKPIDSGLSAAVAKTTFGTEASIAGKLGVINTASTTVHIAADYNRHFGGKLTKTGKPNYGAGIQIVKRF